MTKEKIEQEVDQTEADILALEAQLRDTKAKLREKKIAKLGEHKIVWELEPILKDESKGGDPNTRVRVEYYEDEGKCIHCGWDARDSLELLPYPGQLNQEEWKAMNEALSEHRLEQSTKTPEHPATHDAVMKVRKFDVVESGNNPNRIVANIAGKKYTAAQWAKSEGSRAKFIEQARKEMTIPVQES